MFQVTATSLSVNIEKLERKKQNDWDLDMFKIN